MFSKGKLHDCGQYRIAAGGARQNMDGSQVYARSRPDPASLVGTPSRSCGICESPINSVTRSVAPTELYALNQKLSTSLRSVFLIAKFQVISN